MTKRICGVGARNINDAVIILNRVRALVIRTNRRRLEVQGRTAEIRNLRRTSSILLGDAPLLASGLELLHVRNAGALLRFITILDEVRDRDSSQNGDDGDHDHDFDEGKTLQHFFHGCVFLFFCFVYADRHRTERQIVKAQIQTVEL